MCWKVQIFAVVAIFKLLCAITSRDLLVRSPSVPLSSRTPLMVQRSNFDQSWCQDMRTLDPTEFHWLRFNSSRERAYDTKASHLLRCYLPFLQLRSQTIDSEAYTVLWGCRLNLLTRNTAFVAQNKVMRGLGCIGLEYIRIKDPVMQGSS